MLLLVIVVDLIFFCRTLKVLIYQCLVIIIVLTVIQSCTEYNNVIIIKCSCSHKNLDRMNSFTYAMTVP